jgi:hypothetical protein
MVKVVVVVVVARLLDDLDNWDASACVGCCVVALT